MSCERYAEAIADAAASAAPAVELERHLGECASCRQELAALREALGLADSALGEIAAAEPSPGLRVRIRQAAVENDARVPVAWRWLWPATAAVLLLVAVAAGFWRAGGSAPAPRVAVAVTLQPPPVVRSEGSVGRSTHPLAAAGQAPARSGATGRHPHLAEPEVLVPPGQRAALLRFVALVQRERLAPASLMAAGEPSADLAEPPPIQIRPLEIVPLDPAEGSGT